MTDPRTQLITFPLTLGMDNVSHPEAVQPVGARSRLLASVNTRLSKLPGCVSKAPGSEEVVALTDVTPGGAVPISNEDSTLVAFSGPEASGIVGDEPRRAVGNVATVLGSVTSPLRPQSAYYPVQVERAGFVPGYNTTRFNASVAYHAGRGWTYFVAIRVIGNRGAFVLSVLADDGQEIVAAQAIGPANFQTFEDTWRYASITVHGDTVVFWYAEPNLTQLNAALVQVDPVTHEVLLASQTVIYTLGDSRIQGPERLQIGWDPLDPSNAFVILDDATDADQFRVLKVAIPALTVGPSYLSPILAHKRVGIAYRMGVGLICAASGGGLGQVNEYELNPTSMALVWTQTGQMDQGALSLGFEGFPGFIFRVFATSRIEAGGDGTLVQWRTSAGALQESGQLKHQSMVGPIVTVRQPSGRYYALFTTQVCYRPDLPVDSYNPALGDTSFVPDPSVQVWRVTPQSVAGGSSALLPSPVARLGADIAIRYPGSLTPLAHDATPNQMMIASSSSCIHIGDERALITYLEENVLDGSVAYGYSVRYAQLDLRALQPRFAHTSDGTAVIAGALTATWDGMGVTEFGPMFTPRLSGTATGGTGAALAAGTYRYFSVIMWTDSHGQRHRSPPSNVVTLTSASPLQPTLTVTYYDSLRNMAGLMNYEVVVYASETNGIITYAQNYWIVAYASLLFSDLTRTLTKIDAAIIDAYHPALYTEGGPAEALAAYCPGPSLDAAVIADRVWLLDAERPNRWPFSKPKESLVFPEMSPDLFVETPSSAGRGVALADWNGNPLLLTERGIWTVSGEGPDALNQPPYFSTAVQISDVACTQRLSVVRSPVGVMFVSDNRFVRFSGQIVSYPEIDALLYGAVVGVAVFRKQQEVCWFTAQGNVYVYNWIADAFTLWDQTVTGMETMTGAAQRADGKVVLVSPSAIRVLDPESVSTEAQIWLSTGHVALGDKQDNNLLENVVLHARRGGAHGLVIDMAPDYGSSVAAPKVLSAQQIVDSTNSLNVYDIVAEPEQEANRAVVVALTEEMASGEGFQPMTLTLEVIKKPGKAWRNVPESARV